MKRRILSALLAVIILLSLAACGGGKADTPAENTLTWQEQYDLGIKFLSEGNYEEAIIAFTAAIEIDPKQVDAYISLADAFVAQDDYESAFNILARGIEATGDSSLEDYRKKLEAMQDPWGSLTAEQQEMLQTLDTAVRNFDKYTVESILPSEEFEQLYTTSPLSWTHEDDYGSSQGFNITSDTGTHYDISARSSSSDIQEIELSFVIDYNSVSYTAPYTCSWSYNSGQYDFSILHRTLNEEGIADGPYEYQHWYCTLPHDLEDTEARSGFSFVGTARNGVKVGTETKTNNRRGCVIVVEHDENGYIINYPAEWVDEYGHVKYRCSEGPSGCWISRDPNLAYEPNTF